VILPPVTTSVLARVMTLPFMLGSNWMKLGTPALFASVNAPRNVQLAVPVGQPTVWIVSPCAVTV
jgi:hypothetical protein